MPDYFNRRNRPSTEYSGLEEVSDALRVRLTAIHDEWVQGSDDLWFVSPSDLSSAAIQHLLTDDTMAVLQRGSFADVFTVVELLIERMRLLKSDRRKQALSQVLEAFRLSGSVYQIKEGMVVIIPSDATAKKLAEVERVLTPHEDGYKAFFTAAGDLMGRRRKPDDIVKDLFVGAEAYLKGVTGENDYGLAIKKLRKEGVLNTMQYEVLAKLHGYRSDAHGVGHAGNSPSPTEAEALWFLETLLPQLTHIDRHVKKQRAA